MKAFGICLRCRASLRRQLSTTTGPVTRAFPESKHHEDEQIDKQSPDSSFWLKSFQAQTDRALREPFTPTDRLHGIFRLVPQPIDQENGADIALNLRIQRNGRLERSRVQQRSVVFQFSSQLTVQSANEIITRSTTLDELLRAVQLVEFGQTGGRLLQSCLPTIYNVFSELSPGFSPQKALLSLRFLEAFLRTAGVRLDCAERLPTEFAAIENAQSFPALVELLHKRPKLDNRQISSAIDLVLRHGEGGRDPEPDTLSGYSFGPRQKQQAIEVLSTLVSEDGSDISIRSLIHDKSAHEKTELLALYVESLGRLGATIELWAEWKAIRDTILGTSSQDVSYSTDERRNLFKSFVAAFISSYDSTAATSLLQQAQSVLPSLQSPSLYATLLSTSGSSSSDPRSRKDRDTPTSSAAWSARLTEIVTRLVQSGSKDDIKNVAEAFIAPRSDSAEEAKVWALWAEGMEKLVSMNEEDWIDVIERSLEKAGPSSIPS
jgi:hypothetical protein